ncbi:MAG: hypothetical protein WBQ23_14895 [Bacteroidota bacterium]
MANNLKLVEKVKEIATAKEVTPSQVALAWGSAIKNQRIAFPTAAEIAGAPAASAASYAAGLLL